MSLKHFLPSFRNRYRFVIKQIEAITKENPCNKMLNLGTGEGDYDQALSAYTKLLIGSDINKTDIALAQKINGHVKNLSYEVHDALSSNFKDQHFDIVVCTEVIEHVGDPNALLKEISRILRPGGYAVLTFPSLSFPFTYDPINYAAQKLGWKMPLIHQGAYSFGHDYLIDFDEFSKQAKGQGFQIKTSTPIGGYLIGLLEIYWTGIFQSMFKSNKKNLDASTDHALTIRPTSSKVPALAFITDIVIGIDRRFFTGMRHSVGMGVVLEKI